MTNYTALGGEPTRGVRRRSPDRCHSVGALFAGRLNRTDPRHFNGLRAAAGIVSTEGVAGVNDSSHQEPGNSGEVMQLTSRRFLIAKDGVLYRLADATFARMLQNPRATLAGQRVRMASLIVELIGGKPARVVRSTFATLTFDEDGHMDLGTFTRQQWALAESALDPAFVRTKPEEKVLDASARFIAQGGKLRPSNSLARAINAAALGQVRCRRL